MKTFSKHVGWLKDTGDHEISYIITNIVAYGNILAHIEKTDWERMCKIEAFDHIYVDEDSTDYIYDIRVSKGPWKVEL